LENTVSDGNGNTNTDTLEYMVSDGNGNADTAIVTIVVNGANSNPYAEDDSKTMYHHSMVSASVLLNDSDPEDDKLTVTSVNGSTDGVDTAFTLPSGALVTLSSSGDFTYDPNDQFDSLKEGETGTDTFPYVITDDGNGGYAMATVTIIIPGANDPPVGGNDSIEPILGNVVSDNLLESDSDPEGNPLTVSLPSCAILTVDPTGEFTPG
jgi:VCBS repeat-containing protein